jgi:hypothetical protein
MNHRVRLLYTGLVALFSLSYGAAHAETPPDWGKLAVADVEAAYKETKANHPGMFDPANPKFPQLLEKAKAEALKLARQTKTAGGFDATISRFKAVLNDGHAGAYPSIPEKLQPQIKWPGFVAAWRGDAMYVYKAAEGGPAEGAQILSCDGVPIRTLIQRNVFTFRHGGEVPGEWWSSARLALIDDGNPFVKWPKSCVFKTKGKAEPRTLSWSTIPDYYQDWKNGSANGERLPIGMTERATGLYWFALPDFQPDDAGTAAFKKMYADTEASRDKLLSARGIVLDLRFNQGGSSLWSKNLAERLWGKPQLDKVLKSYFAKTQTWWRPTPGNLAAVKQFSTTLKAQGDKETASYVNMFIPLFEAAIKKDAKWLIEPDSPEAADGAREVEPASLKTAVYVIVPGQCASACLDAIDYFKRFPNTKLIGAPSSADSTYMEVRAVNLPSGMGGTIIPMKMYVDRPRGNGVYYTPDIVMTDFDWSTANFQRRIEADLAIRR